jgi:hypothetical protein
VNISNPIKVSFFVVKSGLFCKKCQPKCGNLTKNREPLSMDGWSKGAQNGPKWKPRNTN